MREVAAILRAKQAHDNTPGIYLAKTIGRSPAHVSRILNGQVQVDIEELERLCNALGRDLLDVITEADKETSSRHLAR